MIAVCQQPNYFSWLGYFEQCARAEKLILLDSVQWIRNGLQNRAKIAPHIEASQKDPTEDFQWLSLPVLGQGHRSKTFGEMKLNPDDHWADRHWKTIRAVYAKRPEFKRQLEPLLRPWFEKAHQYQTLREATIESMKVCFSALDIRPEVVLSSSFAETDQALVKSDRIVSLCKTIGADVYYSGLASASYIDTGAFRDADIRLVWQRWKHTEYEQGRGAFKSHLSIIDALANVPLKEIKSWLEIKPWGPFGNIVP